MSRAPRGAAGIAPIVAEPQGLEAELGGLELANGLFTGAGEVAEGFLVRRGAIDGGQITGAQQAGQVKTSTEAAERGFPPAPNVATSYIHKRTWQPPPPSMSKTDIERSGEYTQVPPQRVQGLGQGLVVKGMLQEILEMRDRRPDLFPRSTGKVP